MAPKCSISCNKDTGTKLPVFRKVSPRATVAPIELTLVFIMFPSQILKLGGTAGHVSSFLPPLIYLYNLTFNKIIDNNIILQLLCLSIYQDITVKLLLTIEGLREHSFQCAARRINFGEAVRGFNAIDFRKNFEK
jgi:hypothetical protein